VKFLLDVPVGREIADWLRDQGYDVLEVRTIDPTLSDLAILRLATQQNRIVITMDKDFGELVVRQGEPHRGIVRLPDVRIPERKVLLNALLERHREALERGAIVTLTRTRVRIRF
jgi:predicted nuclease of predicted toxin-antitoxin system